MRKCQDRPHLKAELRNQEGIRAVAREERELVIERRIQPHTIDAAMGLRVTREADAANARSGERAGSQEIERRGVRP